MKWVANAKYSDREVSIYVTDKGGYALVGDESPCEDWVLARADIGIAARRRGLIEEQARAAAIREGLLVVELLGNEGYSCEHVARYTDVWRGPSTFKMGDHRFRVEIQWNSMPIVGRGETPYAEVGFTLLPSAVRLGVVVVYT